MLVGWDAKRSQRSPDTAELVTVQRPVENLQWEPQQSISVPSDWSLEVYTAPHAPSISERGSQLAAQLTLQSSAPQPRMKHFTCPRLAGGDGCIYGSPQGGGGEEVRDGCLAIVN